MATHPGVPPTAPLPPPLLAHRQANAEMLSLMRVRQRDQQKQQRDERLAERKAAHGALQLQQAMQRDALDKALQLKQEQAAARRHSRRNLCSAKSDGGV